MHASDKGGADQAPKVGISGSAGVDVKSGDVKVGVGVSVSKGFGGGKIKSEGAGGFEAKLKN